MKNLYLNFINCIVICFTIIKCSTEIIGRAKKNKAEISRSYVSSDEERSDFGCIQSLGTVSSKHIPRKSFPTRKDPNYTGSNPKNVVPANKPDTRKLDAMEQQKKKKRRRGDPAKKGKEKIKVFDYF